MLMQSPVLWLINTIVDLYVFILIAAVILNLLISFGIVNRYQPLVQQVGLFLNKMTEPLLSRIRKRLPALGGVDISPLLLFIALRFVQYCANYFLA